MSDLTELFQYLNNSRQSIPIQIVSTTSTNWTQYTIALVVGLLGSIFILYMVFKTIQPSVITFLLKIKMRKILKSSGRSMVIIKHTTQDLFNSSMIGQNTLLKFIEFAGKMQGKDFDLILYTPGGEVFSAMYISQFLREYPGKVRVIIPIYAMSGGTLLALSGDEIIMTSTASLGPVDPQLGNLFKYGSSKSWNHIVKFKGKKAEDSTISFAMLGSQCTKSISNHIESLVMDRITDNSKRREFVRLLTSGDIEHIKILTAAELNRYGLGIKVVSYKDLKPIIKILTSKGFEGEHLLLKK